MWEDYYPDVWDSIDPTALTRRITPFTRDLSDDQFFLAQ